MSTALPRRSSELLAASSLVAVAIVAWGGILLAPGAMFWDDWVAQNDPIGLYRDIGLPWVGPLAQFFFGLGPWSFKVLGVVATAATGYLVFRIAGRGLGLGTFERWVIAALVTALPLNVARAAVAVLETYTVSLAIFVLAWWLLVRRDPAERGRLRYIAAALLLFVSYTTASLLPFTLLPVLHLAVLAMPPGVRGARIVPALLRMAGRWWYVLAAPVLFWIVRTLFFRPTELYSEYNTFLSLSRPFSPALKVTAVVAVLAVVVVAVLVVWLLRASSRRGGVLHALSLLALAAVTAAIAVLVFLSGTTSSPPRWITAGLLLLVAIALVAHAIVMVGRRGEPATPSAARTRATTVLPLAMAGLLVLILGALPYLLVGKIPTFFTWDTRHQYLLPFGIAVLVVAALRVLPRETPAIARAGRAAAVVAVTAVTAVSALMTLSLVADWNKQSQIIAALAADPIVRDADTIVFLDNAAALNFEGRYYPSYEQIGWLRAAFSDEKRFAVEFSSVPEFLESDPQFYVDNGHRYGYDDYRFSLDAAYVQIEAAPGSSRRGLVLGEPSVQLVVTAIDDLRAFN